MNNEINMEPFYAYVDELRERKIKLAEKVVFLEDALVSLMNPRYNLSNTARQYILEVLEEKKRFK